MREGAAIERWGAFLLLATSLWAAAWLGQEARNVVGRTSVREQQLERLSILLAERGKVDDASLATFDGLFPGHQVVWQQTTAGPVLALRAVPDEAPR
jgi:hypothetical protein